MNEITKQLNALLEGQNALNERLDHIEQQQYKLGVLMETRISKSIDLVAEGYQTMYEQFQEIIKIDQSLEKIDNRIAPIEYVLTNMNQNVNNILDEIQPQQPELDEPDFQTSL